MIPKELFIKLSKYYWSPLHPREYTIPHPTTGKAVGIGNIAGKSYAAFNLSYAKVNGKLSTIEDHSVAIKAFVHVEGSLDVIVENAELRSWVCLLGQDEFRRWAVGKVLPAGLKGYLPGSEKTLTFLKP